MRKLKFRGWCRECHEFQPIIGIIHQDDKGITAYCPMHEGGAVELNLEQFTGLHDKNGVEISEGDIVEWQDVDGEKIVAGAVQWRNQFSVWSVGIALTEIEPEDLWLESVYQVIGNIHENRDLLAADRIEELTAPVTDAEVDRTVKAIRRYMATGVTPETGLKAINLIERLARKVAELETEKLDSNSYYEGRIKELENPWVPVSDGFPDEGVPVWGAAAGHAPMLCCFVFIDEGWVIESVIADWWDSKKGWCCDSEFDDDYSWITHYQKLPTPPEVTDD